MDSDFLSKDMVILSPPSACRTKLFFQRLGKMCVRLALFLWALVTLSFFLVRLMPGDPFPNEQGVPSEVMRCLRHTTGLGDPLIVQYIHYVNQLLHGNLGFSLCYPSEPVAKIIAQGFPVSCYLGFQALCFAIPLGILLGGLSAYYADRRFDIIATLGATFGVSVPSFVFAALLQLFLAISVPVFPVARSGNILHTILPSVALAIGPMCSIMRLMRANVLDILSKDWVVTARMKGLSEWHVLLYHIVPNAFLPVVHYLGPTIANLLVGSFIVERVFGIPGLGQWFVTSVISRDYSVILGLTLFYSLILFVIHSSIDVITVFLDPRLVKARN